MNRVQEIANALQAHYPWSEVELPQNDIDPWRAVLRIDEFNALWIFRDWKSEFSAAWYAMEESQKFVCVSTIGFNGGKALEKIVADIRKRLFADDAKAIAAKQRRESQNHRFVTLRAIESRLKGKFKVCQIDELRERVRIESGDFAAYCDEHNSVTFIYTPRLTLAQFAQLAGVTL